MIRPALSGAVALLLASLAPDAAAAALTRQPYLQSVTGGSAVVAFRTDTSCPAVVRWTSPAGSGEAASPAATQHAVKLTGLAAGTTYQYTVEVCGTSVTPARRLRTPAPASARRVHFAAAADFGTGGANYVAVGRALEARDPELLLSPGDIGYPDGTEAQFQDQVFAPWASVLDEIPMYGALGNHDYTTANAAAYLSNFHLPANNAAGTERFYSFDAGHVHFVALDSNCTDEAATPGCTVALQQEWLARDLAATQAAFKVVFLHHPPYSSGEHQSSTAMQRAFGALFEQHGVDLVVTGHDHSYERSKPLKGGAVVPAGSAGAVTYVVAGNGGVLLRAFPGAQPAWSAYRNDKDYGFLDVNVVDGVLSAEMVSTSGAVLDRFTIEKTLAPIVAGAAPAPAPAATDPAAATAPPAATTGGASPVVPAAAVVPPAAVEQAAAAAGGGGCNAGGAATAPALAILLGLVLLRVRRNRRR